MLEFRDESLEQVSDLVTVGLKADGAFRTLCGRMLASTPYSASLARMGYCRGRDRRAELKDVGVEPGSIPWL
jgi:hypothetical protein